MNKQLVLLDFKYVDTVDDVDANTGVSSLKARKSTISTLNSGLKLIIPMAGRKAVVKISRTIKSKQVFIVPSKISFGPYLFIGFFLCNVSVLGLLFLLNQDNNFFKLMKVY